MCVGDGVAAPGEDGCQEKYGEGYADCELVGEGNVVVALLAGEVVEGSGEDAVG